MTNKPTQDLASANPWVVAQELGVFVTTQPDTPVLRLLACDGPMTSRSPSPATLMAMEEPAPTIPAVKRTKRGGKKYRQAAQHAASRDTPNGVLDGGIKALHDSNDGGIKALHGTGPTKPEPTDVQHQENHAPPDGTLYVRGLPDQATHSTLHTLFEQYGQLQRAHVVGRHGGLRYGFVLLHSREAAARAMQDVNGRVLLVRLRVRCLTLSCISSQGSTVHVDWAKGTRGKPPRGRSSRSKEQRIENAV